MSIFSTILQLFNSPFDHDVAHKLYVAIVRQSRLPVFFDAFGVQDTPEGRYDLLAVHAHLVLRRLRDERERTAELSQALFDLMFADLDQNLREMGYGDTGVAKRIRKMAEGFYGRINAYDEGLEEAKTGSTVLLGEALDRNLYRSATVSAGALNAMADYVGAQAVHLSAQDIDSLLSGHVTFCGPNSSVGA